jgi:hypothetical protein
MRRVWRGLRRSGNQAPSLPSRDPVAPGEVVNVRLVAQFPPLPGGVAFFAGRLLERADETCASYRAFSLEPSPRRHRSSGLTAESLGVQTRNVWRFARWLPTSPQLARVCGSGNPSGLVRDLVLMALLRVSGRRSIYTMSPTRSALLPLRALRIVSPANRVPKIGGDALDHANAPLVACIRQKACVFGYPA